MKSEIDTRNFDKFEEEEPWIVEDRNKKGKRGNRQVNYLNSFKKHNLFCIWKIFQQDIEFIGYTFKKDIESQRSHLKQALENLEENMISQGKKVFMKNFKGFIVF